MNPEPVSKDEVNVEINIDVQQQNKKKEAMPRRQNPDSQTCPFARLNIMTEHLDHAVSRTGYLYQTLSLFWSWPQLPSATLPMLLPALYINGPKCWGCLCFTRAGSLGALKNTKHLSGTKQRRLMIAGKAGPPTSAARSREGTSSQDATTPEDGGKAAVISQIYAG